MNTCFIGVSILFLCVVAGCSSGSRSESPEEWSDSQVDEWFDSKEWLESAAVSPGDAIDTKQFAVHYHRHKSRWDTAFAFLADADNYHREVGRYELDGSNVFALVTEYESKDPEDAFYEAHKNYIDIHLLVSGTEFIGRSDLATLTEKTPYDAEKDITFYNGKDGQIMKANPGTFFIFFPTDAHRPSMKVDDNAPVRKIVIKLRHQ